jgi:hypothetical protein
MDLRGTYYHIKTNKFLSNRTQYYIKLRIGIFFNILLNSLIFIISIACHCLHLSSLYDTNTFTVSSLWKITLSVTNRKQNLNK